MATGLAGGFAHIQDLVGSPGDDILVDNAGNTIDGLGGQDLLIAGPAASDLTGTGADLLITGQTGAARIRSHLFTSPLAMIDNYSGKRSERCCVRGKAEPT